MRFSRFGLAGIAAALLGFVSIPASAQTQFNCAMLSGSPYMCLKNESGRPLTAVQAVAQGGGWYNPNGWIAIPNGGVMPGGAAVIKFPAYKGCVQTVVVRAADGTPHYFWNTDVCHNTSLVIRGF